MLRMLPALWLAAAGIVSAGEAPQSIDEQQSEALQLMSAGDQAREAGKKDKAIDFYRVALDSYRTFAAKYPHIQPNVVAFRINHCVDGLEALGYKEKNDEADTNAVPDALVEATAEPAPVPKTTATLAAAKAYLAKGAADEARALLLSALKVEPDNRNVRLLIAVAQCQSARYDDAESILKSLLEEDPKFAQAYATLGTVDFAKGRPDQALEAFRKATELAPAMGEAYFNMAQIHLSKKPPETESAATNYLKAVTLGVKPDEKMDALFRRTSVQPPPLPGAAAQ